MIPDTDITTFILGIKVEKKKGKKILAKAMHRTFEK